jgi:hypothetical protein
MGIAVVIVVFCLSLWGIWHLYASESPPVDEANPPDLTNFARPTDPKSEQSESSSQRSGRA